MKEVRYFGHFLCKIASLVKCQRGRNHPLIALVLSFKLIECDAQVFEQYEKPTCEPVLVERFYKGPEATKWTNFSVHVKRGIIGGTLYAAGL